VKLRQLGRNNYGLNAKGREKMNEIGRFMKATAAFGLLAVGVVGGFSAPAMADGTQSATAGAVASAPTDPIPGPRSCFFERGPFSGDPYINIAYPDADTFYWAAVFTIPAGAKLSLDGNFPHARYMSLQSYDAGGKPIESISDYLIKPAPGSINPYVPGADRSATNRAYSLSVVDTAPPANLPVGMNLVGQTRDELAAPHYGAGQEVILYRIYRNDLGLDETGGAGLPVPVVTLANGQVLKGPKACASLKTRQPLQLNPAAMAVPMEQYNQLLAAAAKISPTFPATNPPTWYMQLDRQALYNIYLDKPNAADAPRSEGGFYGNLDNQYIRTVLNRKLGDVFVVRAKAPTTPKTYHGDAAMGTGELRYWSMCSNQGFANTRVNACAFDENIPAGPDGFYTIVVSRAADRPRNAILACGITWLPMADNGDGAGDKDVTILQLREMLGTGDFPHSIQAINNPADMAKDMGAYYPKGQYMTTSAFEAAVPCLLQKR
jgi:hypothetical protein